MQKLKWKNGQINGESNYLQQKSKLSDSEDDIKSHLNERLLEQVERFNEKLDKVEDKRKKVTSTLHCETRLTAESHLKNLDVPEDL